MRSRLSGILTLVLTSGAMIFAVIIPAQQRGIDINGIWQSSIGRRYVIRSSGDEFNWTVQGTNETARGRVEGGVLFAAWGAGRTEQSVSGRVVEADERGRALRIEWSNGIVFIREPEREPNEQERELRPPGERETSAFGIQIGGTWLSNNKLVYDFIQHGNRFEWRASDGSRGDGFFTEDRQIRSGFPGTGVVPGRIVIGEPPGRAVVIEWQNGLIMTRGEPPGGKPSAEIERPRREFEVPPKLELTRAEELVIHAYALKAKTYNAWIKMGGPVGGLGYDVRFRENTVRGRNTIYVTDNYSGVNKSDNGGATWYASNNGILARSGSSMNAIPVFSLTVDPNNPDNVWCGLKDVSGVYKSANGGATWVEASPRNRGDFVFRGFSVLQGDSNVVFAAGEIPMKQQGKEFDRVRGRVYLTTDGGQNWNVVWDGDNLTRYVLINPSDPSVIYVSTGIFDREAWNSNCTSPLLKGANLAQSYTARGGVGILKSSDGGQTWSVLGRQNGLTDLYVGSLVMHPSNPNILLAGCGNLSASYYSVRGQNKCLGGVFLTTDGGETWLKTLGDEVITAVEFAPSNPKITYASGQHRFYRSTDGGKTWKTVNGLNGNWGPPGVGSGFPIDILVDPIEPDVLFVNNYGGGNVKSTDGGKNWTVASTGYTGALMFDVDIVADKPDTVFASARSGIFGSTDGGANWKGLANPSAIFAEYYSVAVNPKTPTIIVASVEGRGKVYRSTDGGSTWLKVHQLPVIPGDPDQGFGFKRIVFAPSDTQVVYGGTCRPDNRIGKNQTALGIYKSTNGGITWKPANSAQTGLLGINNLAVHPANHNIVYAATLASGLWKTTDAGTSWTKLQGLKATDIRSVAIRPDNPSVVYVGVNNGGVFVSTDNGVSWSPMAMGMEPNDSILALVVDPAHPDIVWAGSNRTGVYRRDSIEQRWVHFNKALSTRAVTDLAISKDGRVLFATTWGEGVFRLELAPVGP